MTAPIPPEPAAPDTSDWLWTTERACTQCGFDPASHSPDDYPAAIGRVSDRIITRLDRPDAAARPAPAVWSPIEYAQHLADVCEVMALRLDEMLDAEPAAVTFASWDGAATAVEKEYWRASAHVTAILLRERAAGAATSFSRPHGDQWSLPATRSDGASFTAASLGLYLLHELSHHAADMNA